MSRISLWGDCIAHFGVSKSIVYKATFEGCVWVKHLFLLEISLHVILSSMHIWDSSVTWLICHSSLQSVRVINPPLFCSPSDDKVLSWPSSCHQCVLTTKTDFMAWSSEVANTEDVSPVARPPIASEHFLNCELTVWNYRVEHVRVSVPRGPRSYESAFRFRTSPVERCPRILLSSGLPRALGSPVCGRWALITLWGKHIFLPRERGKRESKQKKARTNANEKSRLWLEKWTIIET